jgi:putative Mn2+ efflux pump MntP
MKFYFLLLIAVALSLDAFGVSLCVGLNGAVEKRNKFQLSFSFGFFQFFFAICGAYAGFLFNTYIASVPQVIGGALVSIVGILMVKEGFASKEECILIKPGMILVLGVSVSIDALVIGFTTLNNIANRVELFISTVFIGLITFIMCLFAFFISKYLQKIHIVSKYADYIGGVILIIFGIKMMFFK